MDSRTLVSARAFSSRTARRLLGWGPFRWHLVLVACQVSMSRERCEGEGRLKLLLPRRTEMESEVEIRALRASHSVWKWLAMFNCRSHSSQKGRQARQVALDGKNRSDMSIFVPSAVGGLTV